MEVYVNGALISVEDGKYIAKIGNNSSGEIHVITSNEKALVSIDGNEDKVRENTEIVNVLDEEKDVQIVVTAEDGTTKVHHVILQRYSSDNSLLSISANGIDDDKIVQTSETNYQMIVPNDLNEIDLTAVTSKDVAKVKIGDNEYEINKTTRKLTIPDDTNIVKITVQAENGNEKEYSLEIIKKYLLTIDKIVVNDNEAENTDG